MNGLPKVIISTLFILIMYVRHKTFSIAHSIYIYLYYIILFYYDIISFNVTAVNEVLYFVQRALDHVIVKCFFLF